MSEIQLNTNIVNSNTEIQSNLEIPMYTEMSKYSTYQTNEKIYNSNEINNIKSIINDVKNMFPNISPRQLTNLLNSGANIGDLLLNKKNTNDTIINSRGIRLGNAIGPSTNIVEINFEGASNIYSPYLYYNKATTEKFDSVNNYTKN